MIVLHPLSSRRIRRASVVACILAVSFTLYVLLAPLGPLNDQLRAAGTVVLDANGTVLRRDTEAGVRIPVTLNQVAPIVLQATVSAEDQRFEHHPGIDPLAIGPPGLPPGKTRAV